MSKVLLPIIPHQNESKLRQRDREDMEFLFRVGGMLDPED